jgi:hypothetical protein
MKNQINSIESILANFGLQVDDFFVVTFWKTSGEISVQSPVSYTHLRAHETLS